MASKAIQDLPLTTEDGQRIRAIYSRDRDRGVQVQLWINADTTPGAPDFEGTVGEQHVHGYIRRSVRGGFISLVHPSEKDDTGRPRSLGVVNLIVNQAGTPRAAVKMNERLQKKDTIWASISKQVPDEILKRAGLNFDLMAQRRASEHDPTDNTANG